jgi:hypothetical protein
MEKIVSLGSSDLSQREIEEFGEFDKLVYAYSEGNYDGSGFAACRVGTQWFYLELGHCSCYGPTENINTAKNMKLTLDEVIAIAEKNYSEGKLVVEYLNKTYRE